MSKQNLIFLVCGFAFGVLVGIGMYNALADGPELQAMPAGASGAPAPRASMAPNPAAGADGGAPMIGEIRELRKRIDADPQDHESMVRLANLFHDASMFDEAIALYEQALAVRPDDPNQLTDLGICYRGKQEFDRALELFAQANAIDPSHWQSLFNAVIVNSFDLGDYDRAEEALAQMEQIDPQPPRLGDLREAVEQARAQASQGSEG